MPIDPNIALGVRPIEQPNMLGQMAQVMAIRQAQQEYEGSAGVNELSRQGVKDPYAYLQHGKTGRAAFESILKGQKDLREGQKLETELGIAKIGAFRDQLNANVNDPAAAAKWLTAVNSDPLVGKILSSVPLQDQIAGIPSDPKGFADWKNRTMLKAPDFVKHFVESADAQLKSRTDLAQTSMTNNAAMQRHLNPTPQIVTGDNGFYTINPRDPNSAQPVGMRPPTPVVQPQVTNALANPATASTIVTPPVNGLLPPAQSQPGAPTIANAPITQLRPPARTGYEYNDQGRQVKIPQVGIPEGVKLKPGERWSEEKQMVEQIPGSAAFIEQQRKHGSDLGAIKTVETTTKWGKDRIDTILDPKNKAGFENNFGGFSAYATKEFSGDTARVKSELDSLKSDLKERGLQLFRSGGSIGAMTEKEWPIVENMIASLSPKLEADDARDILRKIKVKFDNIESLAAEKYNDQWQGTQYHKPVDTNRNAPASGGDIDTTNKFLK
tara:strand:- start:2360 stop:3850 length:1491 start_codon:yes stop_codon:yes gene_type:complete